jgi:hypothetical protein
VLLTNFRMPDGIEQTVATHKQADRLCRASSVIAKPILAGLHDEYRWEDAA